MIQLNNLQKDFKKNKVLSNVSLAITEPKIIGLIGRNGVGKSTLLKLLAGQLKPTAGQMKVFGEQPFSSLKVAVNTVLIEEGLTFPGNFTLVDILQQGKTFYPSWQQALAEKLLDYADISLKQKHQELSTGQRAVFNLVYGLATRCAVTLLDEPMNGMDEAIRTDFYRAILKEYIAYPRCIILSSHYLSEIEQLIEEIVLIDRGEVALHEAIVDVQEMAIKMRGERSAIEGIIPRSAVLFEREEGAFYEVVVYKEQLSSWQGVTTYPVSASELCKYLTDRKGGIDHVFK